MKYQTFMRSLITLLLVSLSATSCYKAEQHLTTDTPLTYIMWGYDGNHNNIRDSGWIVNVPQNGIGGLTLFFKRQTGDPRNFNIKCNLVNLPSGISTALDSCTAQLDFDTSFVLKANNTIDTGMYKANMIVSNSLNVSKDFPFTIHVLPQ